MNETGHILVELKMFEKGNLKGFADVTFSSEIGEVTIRGFRVIQKDGEGAWVAFPTSSYTKDGKTVSNQILETSRRLKSKIAEGVLAEYRRKKDKTPF